VICTVNTVCYIRNCGIGSCAGGSRTESGLIKSHFWNYQYLLVWMFRHAFQYKIFWYSQFHGLRITNVRPHSKSAPRITKTRDYKKKVTDGETDPS